MTDTFRALCAELADAYLRTLEHINNSTWLGYEPSDDPLLQRARASLADEPPEPAPPADGEVAEFITQIKSYAEYGTPIRLIPFVVKRAADLLQRLSPPQPVPVSERLPGAEDCDAEGRCWWLHVGEDGVGDWFQRAPYPSVTSYAFFRMTHWLPAHALPIPQQQQENTNDH